MGWIGVDLFAGAGGMSLGALQAGIDVRLAVEIDPYAYATYKHNHPDTKIFTDDVRKLRKIDISEKTKSRILFGGPPCQGFSTSNQRTRTSNNPCNWLFREFLRIVALWRPEWVVFENVKGITETENGSFLSIILEDLRSCGYVVTWWILNAADYGVPQKRSRIFIVGSLAGKHMNKPRPTTAHSQYVTVRQAIEDLPRLSNGASKSWMPYRSPARSQYARSLRGKRHSSPNHFVTRNAMHVIERYSHVLQGGNWENIPIKLMRNYKDRTRCHTGIYHRLELDKPSIVISNYRKNMLIHPLEDRGLSVREAARLQSFPDCYEFVGSIGFQQQQVGNSVPPKLARAVFREIIRS